MFFSEEFTDEDGQLHHPTLPASRVFLHDGDTRSNTLVKELWFLHGKRHNDRGSAERNFNNGVLSSEFFLQNDAPRPLSPLLPVSVTYHPARVDGIAHPHILDFLPTHPLQPQQQSFNISGDVIEEWLPDDALIHGAFYNHTTWNDRGVVTMRESVINGELQSCDDRPARIMFDGVTGAIVSEEWFDRNVLHRGNDRPAHILYHRHTHTRGYSVKTCEFYRRGRLHRVGAPARCTFTSDGIPLSYTFYMDGFVHRWSSPAQEQRCEDGTWLCHYAIIGFQYREQINDTPTIHTEDLWRMYSTPMMENLGVKPQREGGKLFGSLMKTGSNTPEPSTRAQQHDNDREQESPTGTHPDNDILTDDDNQSIIDIPRNNVKSAGNGESQNIEIETQLGEGGEAPAQEYDHHDGGGMITGVHRVHTDNHGVEVFEVSRDTVIPKDPVLSSHITNPQLLDYYENLHNVIFHQKRVVDNPTLEEILGKRTTR